MARRARPAVIVGFALLGFLAVVAVRSQPADPDARLPRRFRLVGLIQRQQAQAVDLRAEADRLRDRLAAIRRLPADTVARKLRVESESLSSLPSGRPRKIVPPAMAPSRIVVLSLTRTPCLRAP